MKNWKEDGKFIHSVLADTVKGGDLVKVGDVYGVAVADGDGVNETAVQVDGVFVLARTNTGGGNDAIAQGAKVVVDKSDATKIYDSANASNTESLGTAWEAVAGPDTSVVVKLG